MSTNDRVRDLIAHVERGDIIPAVEKFYAEDVSMRENHGAPTIGKAANLERERAFFDAVQVHEHRARAFAVDGDFATIEWICEFTDPTGQRYRLEQVAVQRWRDGRIIEERFYYDSASLAVAA